MQFQLYAFKCILIRVDIGSVPSVDLSDVHILKWCGKFWLAHPEGVADASWVWPVFAALITQLSAERKDQDVCWHCQAINCTSYALKEEWNCRTHTWWAVLDWSELALRWKNNWHCRVKTCTHRLIWYFSTSFIMYRRWKESMGTEGLQVWHRISRVTATWVAHSRAGKSWHLIGCHQGRRPPAHTHTHSHVR